MKQCTLVFLCMAMVLIARSQDCPTITVNPVATSFITGKKFELKVLVKGLPANTTVTCNWAISTGNIVSGQGTSSIVIDPGNDPGSCTASVEVDGIKAGCNNIASATVDITKAAQRTKISSTQSVTAAGINELVKKFIRLTDFKNLAITQTAAITIYAANTKQYAAIKAMVAKAFTANELLEHQYTILDGGITKTALVDMFLIR